MTQDEVVHVAGACFDIETQPPSAADALVGWLRFGRRDHPHKPKQLRLGPIDLQIRAGSVLGILGPRPLLHRKLFTSIEGREAPSAGTIRVTGRVSSAAAIRDGLQPRHSVADALSAALVSPGGDPDAAKRRLEVAFLFAGMLDLAYVLVRDISEMDRARIAVTACLFRDADIYLLDEMSLMFDPQMLGKIRGHAAVMAASGKTVVLASASDDWLRSASDVIVELGAGIARNRSRAG
ncbi:ATP-binding cassette domain-containing protein [Rhodopseudomonas sp. NSM]|uniref:ATP-binding cassette domain-containing protein n=1 Tax=Rhodopseudomonas sp. NSM TaxID=3457630 RepID=UPI00403717D9